VVPDRIVDAEPHEPAEQEVEVEPLHQLTFQADRVEGLQQQRAQQLLGRDRWAALRRMSLAKVGDNSPSASFTIARIARRG
jgi:hypothetical protein